MNLSSCINKISKYLSSTNTQPLLINVNNPKDLDTILTTFNVGENIFLDVSSLCNKDELPQIENVIEQITSNEKNLFVIGLTSFLRFYGEEEIKSLLNEIIATSIAGKVVVITYLCENLLSFKDPRVQMRIYYVDGIERLLPRLYFVSRDYCSDNERFVVDGIDKVSNAIERTDYTEIFIKTNKHKNIFKKTVYSIIDKHRAYQVIIDKDVVLSSIDEKYATEEQWNFLLSLFEESNSFADICSSRFGNYQHLEMAIPNYPSYDENNKWLYFIALRVFGAPNNECLNNASKNAVSYSLLVQEIYRGLLEKNCFDQDYDDFYIERKQLLSSLNNPLNELIDYCAIVLQKEDKAIYYLTDNTQQEKELIFVLIEKYLQDISKNELEMLLNFVYPELGSYLKDYRFEMPLLNKYFSLYTQCKVINKVLLEMENLVLEQSKAREYNLLETRASKFEHINKNDSCLYFVDAMGVEYLSYIMDKCKEKNLTAKISVCCANLPSLTVNNKEFVDDFKASNLDIKFIKDLDELKHHGTNNYDYQVTKQPIHLIQEMKIINDALDNAKIDLSQGKYKKIIMASDHGASRLSVIHNTETIWEMQSKGIHSGRCCPKADADVQSQFATEENGFWVLANYDRFKGGRKANVEVHGGATLEEVVVPIIEISKAIDKIEVYIIEKTITVSFRKKAAIKLYINTKLDNVEVEIENKFYSAISVNDNTYIVDLSPLKKAKIYQLNVYSSNNLIASNLNFEIKKEGSQEKELF